jgi:hypothetical protein
MLSSVDKMRIVSEGAFELSVICPLVSWVVYAFWIIHLSVFAMLVYATACHHGGSGILDEFSRVVIFSCTCSHSS